ncbi:GAF domain-containing sensor histidine kinase [Magnetococcus sp. PR-3]|uniref:GAF domain-containing sensor histidine kinase n=1 Tax=Magnetococcus sp. PR-3 TaxID=3120355 RepID=UPI002FCE0564
MTSDPTIETQPLRQQWHRRVPLTVKVLLLTLPLLWVAWIVLDHIQTQRVDTIIQKHLETLLGQQAERDRVRLDSFLRKQTQAARVLIHLDVFLNQLQTFEDKGWPKVPQLFDQTRPPWLPKPSIMRSLAYTPHMILLDSEQQLRAHYQELGAKPLPANFLPEILDDMLLIDGRNSLTEREGELFLLTAATLKDAKRQPRATLLIITRLDSAFLSAFQNQARSEGIAIFMDQESQSISASSRPDLITTPIALASIKDHYHMVRKPFLDYGFWSDSSVEFATLVSVKDLRQMGHALLQEEQKERAVQFLGLGLFFMLAALWFARHLQRLTRSMVDFSAKHLGRTSSTSLKGDQLVIMEEQYHQLVNEVIKTRQHDDEKSEALHDANRALGRQQARLEQLVEARTTALNQSNQELRKEAQSRQAISSLLQIALQPKPLDQLLQQALNTLFDLPFLTILNKGTIFLADPESEMLMMRASSGVSKAIKEKCAHVPFGWCLCGRAAHKRQVIFCNHIDEQHDNHPKDMNDHGHYCVPILSSGHVLGVLNLYLEAGAQPDDDQETFLQAAADTIAALIERKMNETALIAREEEIRQLNRNLEHRVDEELAKNREKDLIMMHQARLAAMGEMIGNIAHQWRQPINALNLILANLHDAYIYEELSTEMMDTKMAKSHEIIQRMSTTIDDFRHFFKPDQARTPFSVQTAIKDAFTLIDASFTQNSITLHRPPHEEDAKILGFSNEFIQVLLVILSNARDAIVEQGGDQGTVTISLAKEAHSCTVSIADNGGGIPKDLHGKIFEPYFSDKKMEGTGIGLYMAKMIIEEHMGGKIWTENQLDGATFHLSIPYQPKKSEPSHTPTHPDTTPQETLH